ncbi:MAG: hypothetical protein RIE59_17520, partial [Imperialibacter sp.]
HECHLDASELKLKSSTNGKPSNLSRLESQLKQKPKRSKYDRRNLVWLSIYLNLYDFIVSDGKSIHCLGTSQPENESSGQLV